MMGMNRTTGLAATLALLALLVVPAPPASARVETTDAEFPMLQGLMEEGLTRLRRIGVDPATLREWRGPVGRTDIPDIFGPGAVLSVGNFFLKVTNNGFNGNPFTNISSDPSGQWPGASGIEYVNFIGLAVGAVNPVASDPVAVRRVSYITEWRPATLDPEDRMYRAYDGIANGTRFVNDDGDQDPITGEARFDEDFLDGRDNDGDGAIDEDFAAIGQQVYTCVMRDDTPQAINQAAAERHVPLGLEVRQTAWAYSIPGYTDFNVINYEIFNRSGHQLDSVVVGFRVDMDCGPNDKGNYFSDDFDVPLFPRGDFEIATSATDRRLQLSERRDMPSVPDDSALCSRFNVRVQGFSVADDDGDDARTPGVPSFWLIDHSVDPTGLNGPPKVGFRMFRSHVGGTPYQQGGNPTIDQQRYEMMTAVDASVNRNLDPETGFINATPGDQKGDYQAWVSVGPWRTLAADASVQVTVGVGVQEGSFRLLQEYSTDYTKYQTWLSSHGNCSNCISGPDLLNKYRGLDNALASQVAFEGTYEVKADWPLLPDDHGRETYLRAPRGQTFIISSVNPDCDDRNELPRFVRDNQYTWFDFDCSYCTGAFSTVAGGLFHRTWLAESPPPNPATNLSSNYNYADNPGRRFTPDGDQQVTLAWDNLSEVTPDPKSGEFDFRGYRIWKVSNWTRPVGTNGPNEDDWTLLAEFRMFTQADSNAIPLAGGGYKWPKLLAPATGDSVEVRLYRGDLWNRQTCQVIRPDVTVPCIKNSNGDCVQESGKRLGFAEIEQRTRYPVGRYQFVDREVKNGFLYFYSITSFDSTGSGDAKQELGGRRSSVESESVSPQYTAGKSPRGVWVVPNPYRGTRQLSDRPSAWDLTPNSTDPTGTHVDFMGLPRGAWTIKVFTVSGDLVAELRSTDAVNESIRSPIRGDDGVSRPGYNRQQDNPNDGQARWNLISRNGQDIVSGIYLFTVDAPGQSTQRGRFVVIR